LHFEPGAPPRATSDASFVLEPETSWRRVLARARSPPERTPCTRRDGGRRGSSLPLRGTAPPRCRRYRSGRRLATRGSSGLCFGIRVLRRPRSMLSTSSRLGLREPSRRRDVPAGGDRDQLGGQAAWVGTRGACLVVRDALLAEAARVGELRLAVPWRPFQPDVQLGGAFSLRFGRALLAGEVAHVRPENIDYKILTQERSRGARFVTKQVE